MFFDATGDHQFTVSRFSAGRKFLERILIVSDDGTITVNKPNGIVCRMFHISDVTHLVFAEYNRVRAGMALLRISGEHDLLFVHTSVAFSNCGSAISFVEHLVDSRKRNYGAFQMELIERNDVQLIQEAADLQKPAAYHRPMCPTFSHQVSVPIFFDDFEIRAVEDSKRGADENAFLADSSFLSLLQRARELHPVSALQNPLVCIEVPEPFSSFEIGERFFRAYCQSFEREMCLTVNVHSHLPMLTSFRASKRFWHFTRRLLSISRPPVQHIGQVSVQNIEAYVVGEEADAVSVTLQEWNDCVCQWELDARGGNSLEMIKPEAKQGSGGKFWCHFLKELEQLSNGI